MDKSERYEHLAHLDFGEAVAEHDTELGSYFLETSAYWSVVHDEADLILGTKGSGKSAIARYLSDANVAISELQDVDILPAFNIRGSVLFRKLTEGQDWKHVDFRHLFFAYMVSLVGNHLVKTYEAAHDTQRLARALRAANLAVVDVTVQSVWGRTLDRLRPRGVEAKISLSASPSADLGASFESTDDAAPARMEHLEAIIEASYDLLDQMGRRCWIVFDRLDEAFPENAALESGALRGLMQAHLDLSSYGPGLRSKMFLRLDILDRVTRDQPLVNASHIRTFRILWDTPSILHMIALRVDTEQSRNEALNERGLRRIVRGILPSKMDEQDALVWLLVVTADGFREFNPRNVLYLLRTARLTALQEVDRTDSDAILNRSSLYRGYQQLSIARLQDTIIAEAPTLRTHIEALRGSRMSFKRGELEELLALDGDTLNQVLTALVDVGLFRVKSAYTWVIPPLFRPAMFQSIHGSERSLARRETAQIAEGLVEDDDSVGAGVDGSRDASVSAPAIGDDVELLPNSAETVGQPKQRKRSRGKRKGQNRSGRDELVPSGQGSEIADEVDVLPTLAQQLGSSEELPPEPPPRRRPRFLPPPSLTPREEAEIALRRNVVHDALALADNGDFAGAFDRLNPAWTGHRGTACVAADIAYRSEDARMMDLAREFLSLPTLGLAGAIVARRIVLQFVGARDDVARRTHLLQVNRSNSDEVTIGIMKMVSQSPGQELGFWAESTKWIGAMQSGATWIRAAWPLLAAGRMLAVRRFWIQADPGRYMALREILDEVFIAEVWKDAVPRVEGYLYSYTADPSKASPRFLPYQILSLATVLDSHERLPDYLRDQIAESLARELQASDEEYVERFAAWSPFAAIAGEVMQQLQHMPNRPKVPAVAPHTSQLDRAQAFALRRYSRLKPTALRTPVADEVLASIREAVDAAALPLPGAMAAQAALRVRPDLAREAWGGSGRFSQFVRDYLPDLRHVPNPPPGWVYNPARHSEQDIPQAVSPSSQHRIVGEVQSTIS